MKLKPLYCESCGTECRSHSRPVASYIICNHCNIHVLQTFGKLKMSDGNTITLVYESVNH